MNRKVPIIGINPHHPSHHPSKPYLNRMAFWVESSSALKNSVMTNVRKTACIAYYADGKFIGWWADTSGSIRPLSPKLYGYSEGQMNTIAGNFRSKMSRLNEVSKIADGAVSNRLSEGGKIGLQLMDAGLNADKHELSQYSHVELRVVECPFYDGPNPDFDKVAYEALRESRKADMTAKGIFDIPAPSTERTEAVQAYDKENPMPVCDNWIYADYSKVKEWAANEPTEFLEVITV